jgi:hypothetical protein
MTLDRVRTLAFRTISQIGIRYRRSPLSETSANWPQEAPQAGNRFPWLKLKFSSGTAAEDLFKKLDDTRFNLIVIGQQLPSGLSDHGGVVLAHRIPDDPVNAQVFARAQIPTPSFFLLRPDGHISLAGTHLNHGAVTRYLAGRVGLTEFL